MKTLALLALFAFSAHAEPYCTLTKTGAECTESKRGNGYLSSNGEYNSPNVQTLKKDVYECQGKELKKTKTVHGKVVPQKTIPPHEEWEDGTEKQLEVDTDSITIIGPDPLSILLQSHDSYVQPL